MPAAAPQPAPAAELWRASFDNQMYTLRQTGGRLYIQAVANGISADVPLTNKNGKIGGSGRWQQVGGAGQGYFGVRSLTPDRLEANLIVPVDPATAGNLCTSRWGAASDAFAAGQKNAAAKCRQATAVWLRELQAAPGAAAQVTAALSQPAPARDAFAPTLKRAELSPPSSPEPGAVAAPPVTATGAPQAQDMDGLELRAELELWDAVKGSGDPSLLNDYLRQYPNGRFAAVARARMHAGTGEPPPTANQPSLNAAPPVPFSPDGRTVAPPNSGTVAFFFGGRLVFKPSVFLDDLELARIRRGSYFGVRLAPGPHQVCLETRNKNCSMIDVESPGVYSFIVEIADSNRYRLQPMPSKLISPDSKPITPDLVRANNIFTVDDLRGALAGPYSR
jgi:hypothetical protein